MQLHGYVVIVACEKDDTTLMPIFGQIKENETPSLNWNYNKTTSFNHQFHTYDGTATGSSRNNNYKEFLDYHPLTISHSFEPLSPLFITLKYELVWNFLCH